MFQKVLIAEDLDSINLAIDHVVHELAISEIHHVKYCDDALPKIKRALADGQPFDLMISDLSFKEDGRIVTLTSGEELITAVKKLQPDLPVLVYSIEDKSYRIKSLFEVQKINGFVLKGRDSILQLKKAIQSLFISDEPFLQPELKHLLLDKTSETIEDIDIQIIKHLSEGVMQDEMETVFKSKGITPNSKSTIEKRIGKLKILFRANNTVHLIAIAKDMGIV
jgi:two-component system, NarL family, captular synthesis response regulator RcsB